MIAQQPLLKVVGSPTNTCNNRVLALVSVLVVASSGCVNGSTCT